MQRLRLTWLLTFVSLAAWSSGVAAQTRSHYATAVSVHDTADNNAAYFCEASAGAGGATSQFRRVASDAGSANRVQPNAVNPRMRQRVVAQCVSWFGVGAPVVGSWSTDPGGDRSSVSCPWGSTPTYARCQIESQEPSYTYLASACGAGIASISRADVVAQTLGETQEDPLPSYSPFPRFDTANQNVGGSDLGFPYYADGQLYYAFGDTFRDTDSQQWTGNNAVSRSSDFDPSDGIDVGSFLSSPGGDPRWVAPQDAVTLDARIPGGGFAITDDSGLTRHYLTYMDVDAWGPPSTSARSGIVSSPLGTVDGDWNDEGGPGWGPNSHFRTAATYHDDLGGIIWFFGVTWRDGVYVARVQATHSAIMNPDAYEYYVAGAWLAGPQYAELTTSVLPPGFGTARELSVSWNAYANRYMMLLLNEVTNRIELWQAISAVGPWARVDGGFFGSKLPEGRDWAWPEPDHLYYAPFTNDRLFVNQGEQVHFLLSEFQRYAVFQFQFGVNRLTAFGCQDLPINY